MERRLPFIDAYEERVEAAPVETWAALERTLRHRLSGTPPSLFVKAWNLQPREHRGSWQRGIELSSAVPGFEVSELIPRERLVLSGRHRFSRYAAVFILDDEGDETLLRVETWAVFPGLAGRAYRAMVIGTRMHRLVTLGLLRGVVDQVNPS